MAERGPVYGIHLLKELPLNGGMIQALPSHSDLSRVYQVSQRTAAGYEVLLSHYRKQVAEVDRLKEVIRTVISGNWSVTALQEAIGNGQ